MTYIPHPRELPSNEERFWARVAPSDSGCWLWTGGVTRGGRGTKGGYGKFSVRTQSLLAHRVSYAMTVGDIPDGMDVLHRCHNPACVHPSHLYLGTDAQNVADKAVAGHQPRGETHNSCKLTEAIVRAIRASTADAPALARQYGVHRNAIYNIRRRRTWRHI